MKKFLALLLALSMLCALVACNAKPGTPSAESSTPASPESSSALPESSENAPDDETTKPAPTDPNGADQDMIVLALDGKTYVPMIAPDGLRDGSTEKNAVNAFYRTLADKVGKYLNTKSDFILPNETYDPNSYELLVGNTNRDESEALVEELEKYQFAIQTTENKICIVAYNGQVLEEALNFFMEKLVSGEYGEISKGTLKVKKGINYKSDNSKYALDIALTSSDTLKANAIEQFTIQGPSGTWPQGGYSDGEFYYQAFIKRDYANNEADNIVTIVKYDMLNGKPVQEVGSLQLNHCNDIAYNDKTNEFIVCHNNPYRTRLSILDPVSLTVTRTVEISQKIYSIDYCSERNQYVIGISGGQSFAVLNENFDKVAGAYSPTNRTTGYTTQGVTCDETYIYFVLYNKNVVTVYDWNGKFVTLIKFDVGNIEPENISIVDDVIYIGCARTGKCTVFALEGYQPTEADPIPSQGAGSEED